MIQHFCLLLCDAYMQLAQAIGELKRACELQVPLTRTAKENIARIAIEPLIYELEKLGLQNTETLSYHVTSLHGRLVANEPFETAQLLEALRHIQASLILLLKDLKFAYIPPAQAEFFEQDKLFGEKVFDCFPSARQEVKEAGNCLAVSLSTASVFHLMRVAEYGLRALAHDRKVRIPKNKPIELATWEEIIRELENAEQEIQGYPKTAAREAQFDFFHGAMMEFKRFKNKFRNSVMHSRDSYDQQEAVSAFHHVKTFMQILSSRISETTGTPKIWKGSKWVEK